MDYRRRPQDRKSSRDYHNQGTTPTHNFTAESSNIRSNSDKLPRPKSKYSKRRSSHHSRKSFHNDSDSEEDPNEAAITNSIRGGSTDPERSDENPSAHSNLTSEIQESHQTPTKQIKRRKSKRRLQEEKGTSKAGESHEEDTHEDRDSMKVRRASRSQTDSSTGANSKRKRKRKPRGKGMNKKKNYGTYFSLKWTHKFELFLLFKTPPIGAVYISFFCCFIIY